METDILQEHLEEEYGGTNKYKYDHSTYFDELIKEEEQWFQNLDNNTNNNKVPES